MNKEVQKYLLKLARKTIADLLEIEFPAPKRPEDEILKEKRGAFVTLEIFGKLRGCIGYILPYYSLEEAVKKNASSAAFNDPRFSPLSVEEFKDVEIEISVLSVPIKLEYSGVENLLKKLRPGVDGVVLKKDGYEATYLPQVWEELSNKENFLGSLCVKAGLDFEEWKKGDVEVFTYQAEVFKE